MSNLPLGPIMLDLAGQELAEHERRQLHDPAVGGVILFTRNYQSPQQLAALTRSIRIERAGLLIAADTEGGRVQRFRHGFVELPPAASLGQLYAQDEETALQAAQAFGWILAAELRAVDVDLAFAPVLDICGGVSQIIGDRAFAADPASVIALTHAFCIGFDKAGMASTAKHFPGHGYVVPDSHVELPQDSRSLTELEQCDIKPYTAAIASGLASVMVAHVHYTAIDPLPASISGWWIQDMLRQRMGFSGAVFSDDLSMGGLADFGDAVQRTRLAIDAGCDMIPICNRPDDVAEVLARGGFKANPDSQTRLEALRRPQSFSTLDALHESEEFIRNFSVLRNTLKVKHWS